MNRIVRHRSRGFGLLEILTTVAALIIVLGLMVSLARYVRRRAADQLTGELLAKLDDWAADYHRRHGDWPIVTPFIDDPPPSASTARSAESASAAAESADAKMGGEELPLPDEPSLQERAQANNRDLSAVMRREALARPELNVWPTPPRDDARLLDAWGSPIVFLRGLRPPLGMAPGNRPFFLSAGPDGRFSTLEDNVASYEVGVEEPLPDAPPAAGHRE